MKHDTPRTPADMRRLAEEKLAAKPVELCQARPDDTERLVHELSVHQIQLEMQNEELRRIQQELDASRARYFDLYDLAPVGYCTLSEMGLILEANLTAAVLLGVPRAELVHQRFTRFIVKEDEGIFYLHHKKLFETGAPQECEMRLVNKDGKVFWAHLAATVARDDDGSSSCRVIMIDISESKQGAELQSRQLEELRRWQAVTLGREGRIGELKREVNALAARLGEPPPYGTPEGVEWKEKD